MHDGRNKSQDTSIWKNARLIVLVFSLAILLTSYFYFNHLSKQTKPLDDLYSVLHQQGYHPNIGLSGIFSTGTIIQTLESSKDGQTVVINPPIVIMWGEECFPGLHPVSSGFALPDTYSSLSNTLQLDSASIGRFIGGLTIDNKMARSQVLRLENVHVLTFAKGDLSQQLSNKCVDVLSRSISEGDKAEWFGVINETVVADQLYYEIHWQDETAAEIRQQELEQIKSTLAQIVNVAQPSQTDTEGIKIGLGSESSTVISVQGPVILAYRTRPLQPVYADE